MTQAPIPYYLFIMEELTLTWQSEKHDHGKAMNIGSITTSPSTLLSKVVQNEPCHPRQLSKPNEGVCALEVRFGCVAHILCVSKWAPWWAHMEWRCRV